MTEDQPGAARAVEGEVVEPRDAPESTTALVLAQRERMEMQNVMAWGRLMDASGFFPDTQSAAQAAVKILAGRELGFSTIASMTGIFILDGKPVLGAGLMAQALKRSGKYDYRVREHNEEICAIEVFQRDDDGKWESIGVSTFTKQDAERAELGRRGRNSPNIPSVWEKYPRNLTFARAMSNAIAFYAPDVFEARVYTPEEIRPDLDYDERGEPLDISAVTARPRPMERDPEAPDDRPRTQPAPRTQPPPRPQQSRPAPTEPQRKTKDLAFEDVWNVQTLLTWQHEQWQGDTRAVCTVLEVENTGQIAGKYGPDEDGYRKAAELLWNHFDPESYAAHVARTLDEPPAGPADTAEPDAPEPPPADDAAQEPPLLDEALEAAVDAAPKSEEPPA